MAVSTTNLKAKEVNQILRLFHGTKKSPGIKDARKIGQLVGVPRRKVMCLLEERGLRTYSPGSYA